MANAAKLDKNTTDEKFDDTAVAETAALLEEVDNEEEIFAKEEVTKNLDATQLYLGEIGFSCNILRPTLSTANSRTAAKTKVLIIMTLDTVFVFSGNRFFKFILRMFHLIAVETI